MFFREDQVDEEEEIDNEEPMNCILEAKDFLGGLYIGELMAALNIPSLKSKNIKAIISVTNEMIKFDDKEIIHLIIPALDDTKFNINQYFRISYDFIIENIKKGSVLVHCFRGVSRSGTIVIAFLMKFFKWTYFQSLSFAKTKRKIISPNFGFAKQLILYEKELGT